MREILGKKILIICAHPDDEVLGCGGLIAANSKVGGRSDILVVSEGTTAQYGEDAEASQRRHAQLREAVDLLGGSQLFHWKYPDMRLDEVPHIELNKSLFELINSGGYDYIFTHHPYDVNLDHQVVFRSVLVATRPTTSSPVRGLFTYHINSSTEWGMASHSERFVPNAYLDIDDYLDLKLEALSLYEDEVRDFPHPRSIEAVRERCRVFGTEVGHKAAEAFNIIFWR